MSALPCPGLDDGQHAAASGHGGFGRGRAYLSPKRKRCLLRRPSSPSRVLYSSDWARSYACCDVQKPDLYTPLFTCPFCHLTVSRCSAVTNAKGAAARQQGPQLLGQLPHAGSCAQKATPGCPAHPLPHQPCRSQPPQLGAAPCCRWCHTAAGWRAAGRQALAGLCLDSLAGAGRSAGARCPRSRY